MRKKCPICCSKRGNHLNFIRKKDNQLRQICIEADANLSDFFFILSTTFQVIYTQRSNSWINVHDLLYFLEITQNTVTFLWAAEDTGFRHIYLVTSSLRSMSQMNGCSNTAADGNAATTASRKSAATAGFVMDSHFDFMDASTLQPRIINKVCELEASMNLKTSMSDYLQVALTSGEWEVLGRNLWVDKQKQLVYFLGLRDTPLEKHLYVVSLQRPEHIRLLTEPGYSYLVEFDEVCTGYSIYKVFFFLTFSLIAFSVLSTYAASLLQYSVSALMQDYARYPDM